MHNGTCTHTHAMWLESICLNGNWCWSSLRLRIYYFCILFAHLDDDVAMKDWFTHINRNDLLVMKSLRSNCTNDVSKFTLASYFHKQQSSVIREKKGERERGDTERNKMWHLNSCDRLSWELFAHRIHNSHKKWNKCGSRQTLAARDNVVCASRSLVFF